MKTTRPRSACPDLLGATASTANGGPTGSSKGNSKSSGGSHPAGAGQRICSLERGPEEALLTGLRVLSLLVRRVPKERACSKCGGWAVGCC